MLLLLVHGYAFGTNDQVDFMPYALHLQNPDLFPNDFYISSIGSRMNERWLLAHLVSLIPHAVWAWCFLFIHGGLTLLLISGLYTWSNYFLRSEILKFLVICGVLLISYNINLGGNELYYNMVCGSLIAKALGVWAMWYAFQSHWKQSVVLSVLATYFHPLAGAQILLLSIFLIHSENRIKLVFSSLLLVTPYILLLVWNLEGSLLPDQFTEIMLLRNAHHFFPSHFGLRNYLLLVPIYLVGSIAFIKVNKGIAKMLIFIILGCMFYSIAILFIPKICIMTQWFKATIWLKFFSVLGLIILIEKANLKSLYLKVALVLSLVVLSLKTLRAFSSNTYEFPFTKSGAEVEFALEVKRITNQKAIFLVPPEFTAFKYNAERSTYVDWKAIPHNNESLKEWDKRVKLAYGLNGEYQSLQSIYSQANSHLLLLSEAEKIVLKDEGIDYVVTQNVSKSEYTLMKL